MCQERTGHATMHTHPCTSSNISSSACPTLPAAQRTGPGWPEPAALQTGRERAATCAGPACVHMVDETPRKVWQHVRRHGFGVVCVCVGVCVCIPGAYQGIGQGCKGAKKVIM